MSKAYGVLGTKYLEFQDRIILFSLLAIKGRMFSNEFLISCHHTLFHRHEKKIHVKKIALFVEN